MRRLLSGLWLSAASALGLCAWGNGVVAAQSVETGQLNAAQSYDVGPLGANNGGLDPALWQGVSAARAASQIQAINLTDLSELPRRFMRRVLLSAGVPPQGDQDTQTAYIKASTAAKLQLGDYLALESLSNPQNPLQRESQFRADLALAMGDKSAACTESDREIENRTAPYWMQMRIMCHIMRDESAAAELTLNLMREQDNKDSGFISAADYVLGLAKTAPENISKRSLVLEALMSLGEEDAVSSSISTAVALSETATSGQRMAAWFQSENRLSPEQVKSLMSSILLVDQGLAGGLSFDVDTALAGLDETGTQTKSIAQLYSLASSFNDTNASAKAHAGLLEFADGINFTPQMTNILSEFLPFVSVKVQADLDAERFAWAALRRGDLSTLAGIYRELDEDDPLSGRIALASDALGNGFLLGQLGLDIETRLDGKGSRRKQAVRDALIALALGAQLSDVAVSTLEDYTRTDRLNPVSLARLNAAAKAGSRASTLLYVTQSMGDRSSTQLSDLEIYSYISALTQAGLTREAGELAAFDFLSRIEKTE